MSNSFSKTRILVECALMVALSTVLSLIQIPLMAHGGSITLLSMVPILVVSYRHGTKWGLLAAFVNSLIQFAQGVNNLAYCQTLIAQIGCVLLDYLLAFTVLGLADAIARGISNRLVAVGVGAFVICLLRYTRTFLSTYYQTLIAQIGCVLLDYLLAFTVLGLAVAIAKGFANRLVSVGLSAFAVCLLRYICSFLSGYIVWKDYEYAFEWMSEINFPGIANMSEDGLCWLYSALYNATYMVPETIMTVVAAVILAKAVPKIFSRQSAAA